MTITFTDYLGNPVNVGDTIVVPYGRGSSRIGLFTAKIEDIDEIVPFSNDPADRWGFLYKHRNRPPHEQTRHEIAGDWEFTTEELFRARQTNPDLRNRHVRDLSKAYQLVIRRPGDAKTTRIKKVDRIVVVTSLVNS